MRLLRERVRVLTTCIRRRRLRVAWSLRLRRVSSRSEREPAHWLWPAAGPFDVTSRAPAPDRPGCPAPDETVLVREDDAPLFEFHDAALRIADPVRIACDLDVVHDGVTLDRVRS